MRPPGDNDFDSLRQRALAANAEIIGIDDRGPFDIQVFKKLLHICRQRNVAIWHGHDYKSNAIGLLLRPFWPIKLVTTVHGWVRHTRRTPLYYAVDRFSLRGYERVICVSEDLYQECRQSGVRESRCRLIENAIDTQEYQRRLSTAEAKRQLGLNPDRLLVGAVGRLSEEKGFDRLITAAGNILQKGLDFDLVILGDGASQSSLVALIEALQLTDRVRLLGYRSDTSLWYQAMDVFVLSSLREGLPNVILEAMALETPVIATRVAGVPRVIEQEENGLLVAPGDIDQLASSLAELLVSAEKRARLAIAGRQTIEARYSFARRMEKIRAVYDELLQSPAASRTQHHGQ